MDPNELHQVLGCTFNPDATVRTQAEERLQWMHGQVGFVGTVYQVCVVLHHVILALYASRAVVPQPFCSVFVFVFVYLACLSSSDCNNYFCQAYTTLVVRVVVRMMPCS